MRGGISIKDSKLFLMIFSVVVLAFFVIFPVYYYNHHHSFKKPITPSQHQQKPNQPNQHPQKQPPNNPPENNPSTSKLYWGVDTASKVTGPFYQCVEQHYGKPDAIGRYLGTNSGTSEGLTNEEVIFLKQKGLKITPIYNHFSNATGYLNGVSQAQSAVALAKQLGISEGVVIYADIEPNYPVDSEFIRGWVETISSSPYKPGIYGVFLNGKQLSNAFNQAISNNKDIKTKTFIWTSNPQAGTTPKQNAPQYNPNTPNFINAVIWQYGMKGKQCNIDTNLIQENAFSASW